MPKITVSDVIIDVERKSIKNLHLAVHPPFGRVRIAAPMHIDDDVIRLFAVSKLSWIKNKIIRFSQQKRQTEREYVSGESHYFQGQRYLLNVVYGVSENKVLLRNKDLFGFIC